MSGANSRADDTRLASLSLLESEILLLSDLSKERLEEAGIELTVGIECYRDELIQRNANAACDPFEEFLSFADQPGLDYSTVEGSEIGDLLPQQMYLAVARSWMDTARYFIDSRAFRDGWTPQKAADNALRYELASRQLVDAAFGSHWAKH